MGKEKDPMELLNELLSFARIAPSQKFFEYAGHKITEGKEEDPLEMLRHCSQAFLFGALPSPEILLFIASSIERYVAAQGSLSLDEAFRLKSIPKTGNPSAQFRKRNDLVGRLFDMAMMKAADPSLRLARAAELACGDEQLYTAETLAREYRSRGCKKWETELFGE